MGLTYIKAGMTTVCSLQFMHWHELLQVTTIENHWEQSATLSQREKFHKSIKMAQEIGSLASEVGVAEFRRRYDDLKTLRDAWMNGKDVLVSVLNESTCTYMQFVIIIHMV